MSGSTTTLRLPRCCTEHRFAALDAVSTLFTNDALAEFDDLVADGWPAADAVDLLHQGYRNWLHELVDVEVDVALLAIGEAVTSS
jgi:hypothetical protein